MKKTAFFLYVLLFNTVCLAGEETVTNFAELEVAVHDNESTPIHLNAATFTMTESLIIDYECIIDVINQNATIDGNGVGEVSITGSPVAIGNPTGNYTLTFTNSVDEGVEVLAQAAAVVVTFNYCKFNSNAAGATSGLFLFDGKGFDLTVICNNCEANSNGLDGFTIKSHGDGTAGVTSLILNNCDGKNNNTGSTVSNGATAHNSWHTVTINGGEWSGNGGPGIIFVGGSTGNIYDATILNNGQHADSKVQIEMATGASLLMEDCTVTVLAEINGIGLNLTSTGTVIVRNTEFIGNSTANYHVSISDVTISVTLEYCIFRDMTRASTYAVKLNGDNITISIKNCVFYNNTRHILLPTTNFTCNNTIFHTSAIGILPDVNEFPYSGGSSGYNCWYNNTDNFFSRDTLASTDLEADPQFVDPANSNFRLSRGSPCQNAGVDVGLSRDFGGKAISNHPEIGAYELTGSSRSRALGGKINRRERYNF